MSLRVDTMAVPPSDGLYMRLPTAAEFRAMTRPQLVKLAEEDGVEVSPTMPKKDVAALVKTLFDLEQLWADQKQERDQKFELEKQERDQKFELEKLRLEVERVTREKGVSAEPAFKISDAQRLEPQRMWMCFLKILNA